MFGIVPIVFKNACFSQFWVFFLGRFLLVYLCLEDLGVFVFLVFGYFFGVGFVSVCLLCFVLWLEFVVSVFVFCVCFFFVFCFCGGFKGQVRWPEGPPHLALNPPYFLVFVFCLLRFVCCLFCVFFCFYFFGGFKGQVRWPKGPPHLALNPPYLFFCFLFFSSLPFLSLFLIGKPCFPPPPPHKKGNFADLSVFPFASL